MKYNAYVFELMDLAEPIKASELWPDTSAVSLEVQAVPVWVDSWKDVTFGFEYFDGVIGLPDGQEIRLRNVDDEPVRVYPNGLFLTDFTEFVSGPWSPQDQRRYRNRSVFFEFVPA